MNKATIRLFENDLRYKSLIELATYDREAFRLEAAKAFTEYGVEDRLATKKFDLKEVDLWKLLDIWKNELLPNLAELEKNRQKLSFNKTLARQLLCDSEAATTMIDDLVKKRRGELYNELILRYSQPRDKKKDDGASRRRFMAAFFQRTQNDIDSFRLRYADFLLYKVVASICFVTVVDPQTAWLERQKTLLFVRKERKKLSASEEQRLLEITSRLAHLSAQQKGLAGKIVDNNWDLVAMMSLRNTYEKRLLKTLDTGKHHPLERLTIFESVTKEFCDLHVLAYAEKRPTETSLAGIKHVLDEVNAVLLQFFDLSNTQKNQLLSFTNEARQLIKERAAIKDIQRRRSEALTASSR
jgi:hypothetical protein